MKSLRLLPLLLLLVAKPPAVGASPLDKLDPDKVPEEARKLLSIPDLVGFLFEHPRAIGSLAFSPDGKRLALSSWSNKLEIWEFGSDEPKLWASLDGTPSGVAFSPDGRWLAAGGDGRAVIWDLSGDRPKLLFKLAGHRFRPFAVQFAPGKAPLLATASHEPVLRLWKFEEGEPEAWAVLANEKVNSRGISSLAFSGDGKLLAAGNHLGKDTLRIWDLSGTFLDERTIPSTAARLVAFSPKKPLLAFSGDDETVRVWDVNKAEPKELHILKGHAAKTDPPAIKAIAFAPAGDILATAGQDRKLILWDAATGKKVREWHFKDEARALAFTPDGRHLAVGNHDGSVYLLRLARPKNGE